jgi:RNA polymerase sigma-70 factor (ECF subfamily)
MTVAPDDWAAWLGERGAAMLLFARQLTLDGTEAEDVVQEAFVRFWRSRNNALDPVAYLYTCVKNCALEWHRKCRRRVRREETAARPESQPGDILFFCPLEHDERRQAIEAAMRRLPEAQREVLVLHIWGDLSFPQIAETLDISANTAASRYRYAVAKLRETLAEEPIT